MRAISAFNASRKFLVMPPISVRLDGGQSLYVSHSQGKLMRSITAITLFLFTVLGASPAFAVSFGFEASQGYSLGPLSPLGGPTQAGWSGGAQAGFTNNDPTDEQVINTEAYSGTNSWHYARGYGSSGQGTPFSPITALEAGPGTQLDFSIAFKAASAAGDGSEQNMYVGTTAGNDRTGFNIYLTNDSAGDGLSLHTFADLTFAETVFATNLSRTDWHVLTVSAVFDADSVNDDVYQYSLNGALLFVGNSWPNPWRVDNGFTLSYGNSIKFADGGGDNPAHEGFYYDTMSYDVSATSPVPEPAALLLALLGLALLPRRRGR